MCAEEGNSVGFCGRAAPDLPNLWYLISTQVGIKELRGMSRKSSKAGTARRGSPGNTECSHLPNSTFPLLKVPDFPPGKGTTAGKANNKFVLHPQSSWGDICLPVGINIKVLVSQCSALGLDALGLSLAPDFLWSLLDSRLSLGQMNVCLTRISF